MEGEDTLISGCKTQLTDPASQYCFLFPALVIESHITSSPPFLVQNYASYPTSPNPSPELEDGKQLRSTNYMRNTETWSELYPTISPLLPKGPGTRSMGMLPARNSTSTDTSPFVGKHSLLLLPTMKTTLGNVVLLPMVFQKEPSVARKVR